jgi:hypothetical protein
VTTIRRSSIDRSAQLCRDPRSLAGTPGIVFQDIGPTIRDIPTEAVTLVPNFPVADTGLTREVVYVAVPTGLPLRILGYEGNTLVRQINLSNIILRP